MTRLPKTTLISAFLFLSACGEGLVYGERFGFNLAIRTDIAESAPLEVNAGLQRRVIGFIPPSGLGANGEPKGEGVNMFSRFDLQRDDDTTSPFGGTLRISTSFASGAAATAIAGTPEVVAAVTRAPVITFSSDPAQREIITKLINFTGESQANAQLYLGLATQQGLSIQNGGTPNTQAVATIGFPGNAEGNKAISGFLRL